MPGETAAAAVGGEDLGLIVGPVGSEDIVHVPGTPWLIASGLNLGAPAQLSLIDTRTKTAVALALTCLPATEGDPGASPPELSRMYPSISCGAWPKSSAEPSSAVCSPNRREMAVDLPAPLGPRTASSWPASLTARSNPSSA